MSNGTPGKKLGFASFFADAKETSTEIVTPIKSVHHDHRPSSTDSKSRSLHHHKHQTTKKPATYQSHKFGNGDHIKASSARASNSKRNYKCIADPELDKTLPKGSKVVLRYAGESAEPISVIDPRKSREYASKVVKGKKKYRPELRQLQWPRDENSVGPGPPTSILISELSVLTTNHEIANQFRSFGEMSETKLQVDPSNGASLGLCRVTYRKSRSNHRAASDAAKNAVQKMHGAKLGGQILKVEFDDDGKLCDDSIRSILEQRKQAEQLASEVNHKVVQVPSNPKASSTASSVPTGPKAMLPSSRETSRSTHRDASPRTDKSIRTEKTTEIKKYGKDSSFRARDMSKISSGTSETNKRLGHYAYIFIPGKVLPLHKVTAQELQIHFSGKRTEDIFTDPYGFYVLFENDEVATRAHKIMDKSTFLGYRLYMELHKAKRASTIIHEKPLGGAFKKTFQPVKATVDPIMEATTRVIKELQDVFMRDLRNRVTGPILLDFLDPANFKHLSQSEDVTVTNQLNSTVLKTTTEHIKLDDNEDKTHIKKLSQVLSHIPRFKKKRALPRDTGRMRVNHRMDHHTMYAANSDESDRDEDEEEDDESLEKHSDRPSSVAASIEMDEDGSNTPLEKSKKKIRDMNQASGPRLKDLSAEDILDTEELVGSPDSGIGDHGLKDILSPKPQSKPISHKRRIVDFTSSEEEDEPHVEKSLPLDDLIHSSKADNILEQTVLSNQPTDICAVELNESQPVPGRKQKLLNKAKISAIAKPITIKERNPSPESDEESEIEDVGPVLEPDDLHLEDEVVLDIDGIQNIVKDDEDFYFLQSVLKHESIADVKNVTLWAWRQKESKASHADGYKGVTKLPKDTGYNRVNSTGSAKTEGYYSIPDIEKSFYLPNRNRAVVTEPGLNNSSSRMNRANNRRQAAGIEAQRQTLEAQTDLLRFNALKSRKKQLKFSRSAIHDWGLYALEHIERGDMVIEYVGEIIRQQVADHREKRYERQGIGSSYLFRIDEDTVIDATKCGNIARFINHSCDPSCTAKIITVYGQKKIVIYAQRDIGLGEEITYDYKFPLEDEKIPCLCGSPICRKFLN